MKKKIIIAATFAFCVMTISAGFSDSDPIVLSPYNESESHVISLTTNQEPLTTTNGDTKDFEIVMSVITHPRCMNCHPMGDRPTQGDDGHIHTFNIQRGKDGHGMPNAQCSTCHQSENNNYSGVPGAPHWHLAPKSMGWQGLTKYEIAASILNKENNGGRSHEEIRHHLKHDPLILWAFDPGVNNEGVQREKPPVSFEEFKKAVDSWFDGGAIIPKQ